jgi:ABC-type bacteriocin/lantibiotic exporter with double-glycine peptidase domain
MLNQNSAPILLLDEPTSHLDGESQEKVLQNLFKMSE